MGLLPEFNGCNKFMSILKNLGLYVYNFIDNLLPADFETSSKIIKKICESLRKKFELYFI